MTLLMLFSFLVILSNSALSVVSGSQTFHATHHYKQEKNKAIAKQQIISRIFNSNYDSNSRPPVKDLTRHTAVIVVESIYINRIAWHENSAVCFFVNKKIDLNLRQQWEDTRLAFESNIIHEVSLPKNFLIWHPDTSFVGVDSTPSDKYLRATINRLGFVRTDQRFVVTAETQNAGSFPFSNRKSLTLKLSSFDYSTEDVVYLWANSPPNMLPVEVSEKILDGSDELTFEDASAGDCVGNSSTGTYSCIEVTITFKGSPVAEIFKIFLPSILLVISSWLHFWIHGSWSVPRTISAAAPFLLFVGALFLAPGHSKIVLNWIIVCAVITFLSLIEYFLVIYYNMHQRIQLAPSILNGDSVALKTTKTGPIVYHSINNGNNNNNNNNIPHNNEFHDDVDYERDIPKPFKTVTSINQSNVLNLNSRIDYVSRVLFPVLFVICFVIFFIYFSI